METKQILTKKRCVVRHDATTKENISRVLLTRDLKPNLAITLEKKSRLSEEKRKKERVTPEFGE
jgi:hypothetical protein